MVHAGALNRYPYSRRARAKSIPQNYGGDANKKGARRRPVYSRLRARRATGCTCGSAAITPSLRREYNEYTLRFGTVRGVARERLRSVCAASGAGSLRSRRDRGLVRLRNGIGARRIQIRRSGCNAPSNRAPHGISTHARAGSAAPCSTRSAALRPCASCHAKHQGRTDREYTNFLFHDFLLHLKHHVSRGKRRWMRHVP
jgi:hypothetical protein